VAAPRRRGYQPTAEIVEALRLALQALVANRMRSVLTMLGVILGVGSVIVMIALGQGVAIATQEAIQKLGTNVLSVSPSSQQRGGVSQGLGSLQTLKLADVAAVLKQCPSVGKAAPEYRSSAQVKYKNQNTRTTVYGTSPEYFGIRNMPLADGRVFRSSEVRRGAKVVVLGYGVRTTLFGSQPALGRYIKLNRQNFLVIGSIQQRGSSGPFSADDQVLIPITTAMNRVFGSDHLTGISVQAVSEAKMRSAQDEIVKVISAAHKLEPGADPDVRVFNQADISESAAQQNKFLTQLLAGIALVSLIVGGIGIMNIMLVSVTERTHEIGIRKAVGAKRRDILYQFMIEAVTLSLVGGVIGILGGIGVSLWMAAPKTSGGFGFPMHLSGTPMAVSFCFAAAVGIFFGIYPALKASALDPIDALRYE
jgi:putative ABC transport system permease protein